MKNPPSNQFIKLNEILSATLAIASFFWGAFGLPIKAQPTGNNEIPKEREIHNTFSGDEKGATFLDAANPMDLLNRLRRATAMDDATPPSDAIDEALKAFDLQEEQNEPSPGLRP